MSYQNNIEENNSKRKYTDFIDNINEISTTYCEDFINKKIKQTIDDNHTILNNSSIEPFNFVDIFKSYENLKYEYLNNIITNTAILNDCYGLCGIIDYFVAKHEFDMISIILNSEINTDIRNYLYEFIVHNIRPYITGNDVTVESEIAKKYYETDKMNQYIILMTKIISENNYDTYFDPNMIINGNLLEEVTYYTMFKMLSVYRKFDLVKLLLERDDFIVYDESCKCIQYFMLDECWDGKKSLNTLINVFKEYNYSNNIFTENKSLKHSELIKICPIMKKVNDNIKNSYINNNVTKYQTTDIVNSYDIFNINNFIDKMFMHKVFENDFLLCYIIQFLIENGDYDTISVILNNNIDQNIREYLYEFICHNIAPYTDGDSLNYVKNNNVIISYYPKSKMNRYEKLMIKIIYVNGFDNFFNPNMRMNGKLLETFTYNHIFSVFIYQNKPELARLLINHKNFELVAYINKLDNDGYLNLWCGKKSLESLINDKLNK